MGPGGGGRRCRNRPLRAAWAIWITAALALAVPTAAPARADFDPPAVLEREADYAKARSMIEAGAWEAALGRLRGLSTDYPREAEVHSLIGLSLRKLGRTEEARLAYMVALSLDHRHVGTNAYLGELYVETGRLDLARERLAVLERVCGPDCEEARDLGAIIAAAAAAGHD